MSNWLCSATVVLTLMRCRDNSPATSPVSIPATLAAQIVHGHAVDLGQPDPQSLAEGRAALADPVESDVEGLANGAAEPMTLR